MIKTITRKIEGLPIFMELEGLPPSVNQMYRNAGSRRYKRAEVEQWQEELTGEIRRIWGDRPAYMGEVEVHVDFVKSTQRKWDIDNRLKVLFDCFEMAGVIADDAQISKIWAQRLEGVKDSTVIVMDKYKADNKKS